MAAKAPLYFKKGIDDAESEWSQHHAKRWIDTSAKVPPSFEKEFTVHGVLSLCMLGRMWQTCCPIVGCCVQL